MRVFDILVLLALFGALGWGMHALYQTIPVRENLAYNAYVANLSQDLPAQSGQFYPNMRYQSREISYTAEEACTSKKKQDIARAISILETRTALRFKQNQSKPEIRYVCSELPALPEMQEHFVAGEGGPMEIINASRYAVIVSGKVSLYRTEHCDKPLITLHETLHALGFDHTKDARSVMYPVSDCQQDLDDAIIQRINELYRADTLPDLAIERATANMQGVYLAFDINVSNYGLKDVTNVSLIVSAEGEVVKILPMSGIKIGQRRSLNARNIRLPHEATTLEFIVTEAENEKEISLDNNRAELHLAAQQAA